MGWTVPCCSPQTTKPPVVDNATKRGAPTTAKRPQHEPCALPVQPAGRPPSSTWPWPCPSEASLERSRPPADESNGANQVAQRHPHLSKDRTTKCAGILVENVWRGASWSATVMGVGVNVNFESADVPISPPRACTKHGKSITLLPSDVGQLQTRDSWNSWPTPCLRPPSMRGFKDLFGLGAERHFDVGDRTNVARVFQAVRRGRAVAPQFARAESGPDEWLQSGDVKWRFEDAGQNAPEAPQPFCQTSRSRLAPPSFW